MKSEQKHEIKGAPGDGLEAGAAFADSVDEPIDVGVRDGDWPIEGTDVDGESRAVQPIFNAYVAAERVVFLFENKQHEIPEDLAEAIRKLAASIQYNPAIAAWRQSRTSGVPQ